MRDSLFLKFLYPSVKINLLSPAARVKFLRDVETTAEISATLRSLNAVLILLQLRTSSLQYTEQAVLRLLLLGRPFYGRLLSLLTFLFAGQYERLSANKFYQNHLHEMEAECGPRKHGMEWWAWPALH